MATNQAQLTVRIVTGPDPACGGATWSGAVDMVRGRLARRFGGVVSVEHVTVFSPQFFEMTEVAHEVRSGQELPLVLVGDTIVSRGGKLSVPTIARALEASGMKAEEGAEP